MLQNYYACCRAVARRPPTGIDCSGAGLSPSGVSSLRLRPGDYAIAGESRISIVDAGSFRITGYFEETKIRHVRPGRPAQIRLMGFDRPLSGHVDSIGRGIENDNDTPGAQGLPDVPETFAWVRLARRIPVRIRIDAVPPLPFSSRKN